VYDIEMHEASKEFSNCWLAACRHIHNLAQGSHLSWFKSNLTPPILEHLSFRIRNQLFYVRIEDVDGQLITPGRPTGILSIATGCNGNACLMPMKRSIDGWRPEAPDCGLIDATTRKPINPVSLVTGEKIEMADWELHDFAVQIVRDFVDKELGYQLMSSQGNPRVNPSMWFVGENGPEWVVVRAVRFPEKEAIPPSNIRGIATSCAHVGQVGHFASVAVANSEEAFGHGVPAPPLWRGHGMSVNFEGLVSAKVH
jgi:hypothetical protein